MIKFRASNSKRANINLDQSQLITIIEKAINDNSLRGFLYKRSSTNTKWRLKWFLLYQNLLFYFDLGQSIAQLSDTHNPDNQNNDHNHSINNTTQTSTISGSGSSSGNRDGSPFKSPAEAQANHNGNINSNSNDISTTSSGIASGSGASKSPSRRFGSSLLPIKSSLRSAGRSKSPKLGAQDDTLNNNGANSTMAPLRSAYSRRASAAPNLAPLPASGDVFAVDPRQQHQASATPPQASEEQRWAQRLASEPSAAACQCSAIASGNHVQLPGALSCTASTCSVSGVSLVGSASVMSHEQVSVGRSTTWRNPKALTLTSLLSSKMGLIMLEGSYCERLVDLRGSRNSLIGEHPSIERSQTPLEALAGLSGANSGVKSNLFGVGGGGASSPGSLVLVAAQNGHHRGDSDEKLECTFALSWAKRGSKAYEFRTETEAECRTWVHAISRARYSTLMQDKEQVEQKYLHLSQIVESESTAKWQYSRQCEELSAEIKKLRHEICHLKRRENRSNQLGLVLSKSQAIVDVIVRQQQHQLRLKQQQDAKQRSLQHPQAPSGHSQKPSEALQSGQPRAISGGHELGPLSPTSRMLVKAHTLNLTPSRSIDQEQREHELAMRRARRLSHLRRHQRPLVASRALADSCGLEHLLEQSAARSACWSSMVEGGGGPTKRVPSEPQRQGSLASLRTQQHEHQHQRFQQQQQQSLGGVVKLQTGEGKQALEQAKPLEATDDDELDESLSLSDELKSVVAALNHNGILLSDCLLEEAENSDEIRKIKKVQGFFRGWLCRRRWKMIVQEYIKSPHAESMRKRNHLVFRMVECEEEYVEQLTLLISAFLRPMKMAASSSRPALSHDELSSIFLNSETLLFLHQIFLKGLMARMGSWPTLVLADLFNMLLPMLTIYQEYVRNHHFSLQVLAECKQREQFSHLLNKLEEKPQLNGRTLETFLTYPMHQVPRYIICLHEILAHTPHNHVERKSLYEAQTQLEDLSRQMHDEVSETENIRQNLAIERMIIGGCDILLDVNQVFIRQGILVQILDPQTYQHQHHHSHSHNNYNANNLDSSKSSKTKSKERSSKQSINSTSNSTFANGSAKHKDKSGHSKKDKNQKVATAGAFEALGSKATLEQRQQLLDELLHPLGFNCDLKETHVGCPNPNPNPNISTNNNNYLNSEHQAVNNNHHELRNNQKHCYDFSGYPNYASSSPAGYVTASNITFAGGAGNARSTSGSRGWSLGGHFLFGSSHHNQHQRGPQVSSHIAYSKEPIRVNQLSGHLELTRHCFLFTNYLLLCVRGEDGKLRLLEDIGRISLTEVTLIENPHEFVFQQPVYGPIETPRSLAPVVGADQLGGVHDSPLNDSAGELPSLVCEQPKSSSTRLASYLVSKLSNLTGLMSGGFGGSSSQATNQNQSQATVQYAEPYGASIGSTYKSTSESVWSSSAPPSPVTKWHRHSSIFATPKAGATTNAPFSSQFGGRQSVAANHQILHDFGGCDFLLLVDKAVDQPHSCDTTRSAGDKPVDLNDNSNTSSSIIQSSIKSSSSSSLKSSKASKKHQHQQPSTITSSLHHQTKQQPKSYAIHLVAPNLQEKAAWMSDLSQCIDNVHFNDLFHSSVADASVLGNNQSPKDDPRLFKDDVDIRFSRALNSCKLPQIRYASKERLFERLTDLRFLSVDFLNTFLLTYRVFTSADEVIEAIKSVLYNCDREYEQQQQKQHQQLQLEANQHQMEVEFELQNKQLQCKSSNLSNTKSQPEMMPQQSHSCPSQHQQANNNNNGNELGPCKDNSNPQQQQPAITTLSSATDNHKSASTTGSRPTKPVVPVRPNAKPLAQATTTTAPSTPSKDVLGTGSITGSNKLQLSLPHASATSKRRSTLCALSPITGSSASSLVNLCPTQPASQDDDANNQLVSDDYKDSSRTKQQEVRRTRADDPAGSPISNHLSPTIDSRARSSSMSVNFQLAHSSGSQSRLDVPQSMAPFGRQVRASSMSHVSDRGDHGVEHWRLIHYKATIAQQQQQQQQQSHQQQKAEPSKIQFQFELKQADKPDKASDDGQDRGFSDTELSNLLHLSGAQVPPSTPVEGGHNSGTSSSSLSSSSSSLTTSTSSNGSSKSKSKSKSREPKSGAESELLVSDNDHEGTTGATNHAQTASAGAQLSTSGCSVATPTRSSARNRFAKLVKEIDFVAAKTFDTSADETSQDESDEDDDHAHDTTKLVMKYNEKKSKQREKRKINKKKQRESSNSIIDDTSPGLGRSFVHPPPPEVALMSPEVPSELSRSPDEALVESEASSSRTMMKNSRIGTPRDSCASTSLGIDTPMMPPSGCPLATPSEQRRSSRAGVVVSSSKPRLTTRRSSNASAVSAFAAATAASDNPILVQPPFAVGAPATPDVELAGYRGADTSSVATNSRASSSAGLMSAAEVASLAGSQAAAATGATSGENQHHGQRLASTASSLASSACLTCKCAPWASVQGRPRHAHGRLSGAQTARQIAVVRVLSVLRDWLSKHSQDFVNDPNLAIKMQSFLRELINDPKLLPSEHKSAIQLEQLVEKASLSRGQQVDLDLLLAIPKNPPSQSVVDMMSTAQIAEAMTYLDHKIFLAIRSEEFLNQAWMRPDKAIRAPHILLMTKRFNDVSRLVSSEIIRVHDLTERVALIEKWTTVAANCRTMRNFNGVLQICAAFTNSAIFRLKKTWDTVQKSTKQIIEQLQSLVSTDSRFRNMRDAITRSDPPSIPYVGMYLTDLSFIEEGTPSYSPDGLLNFSKMRMIAHVIREIQHLQSARYKLKFDREAIDYLLDASRYMQDEEMYRNSLAIEPRSNSSGAKGFTSSHKGDHSGVG